MMDLNSTALKIEKGRLYVLDQTQLPHREEWLPSNTPDHMIRIIKNLSVRGAPLIGVAAALQLGMLAESHCTKEEYEKALEALNAARPTAVNLMHAMARMRNAPKPAEEAIRIFQEDIKLSQRISEHGASVIADGDRVLTHCNTGGLATAGLGTALGAILKAHSSGKKLHVFVDETRPLLQGGRLTTWELGRAGVPFTLICDNMAGFAMQKGQVDKVMVGADRIARNGDFANKVGTYSLAVLCKHHKIPFYVVAPRTTVDWECATGNDIEIEQRQGSEVRGSWAPPQAHVWNPAFDVTPAGLVTGWILDHGIFNQTQISQLGG